jgi:hypothetical protein
MVTSNCAIALDSLQEKKRGHTLISKGQNLRRSSD